MLYLYLFLLGGAVGFMSGLLGIGGGIIMFPVLFYLTPRFGFEPIGVKDITGLTMVQGFFASLSAMLFYHRHRMVHRPLVLTLGLSIFLSSLCGSLVSKWLPDRLLVGVFAVLALAAAVMMFLPRSYAGDEQTEESVSFSRPTAVILGTFLGFFLGMVGQGGAFIVIPVLLYVLRIPFRVAVGSTLAIGLFSTTAGLIGKLSTSQVPLLLAAALLAGAIPTAQLGGYAGRRINTVVLKWLLAVIIGLTSLKLLLDVLA